MRKRLLWFAAIALVAVAVLSLWPTPPTVRHAYFDAAPADRAEIIAHGGGQGVRPTNTMSALDEAAAMGADVLEVDVQQTADGVLVLLHDDSLERTTNISGRVREMTVAQVQEADAGDNDEIAGQRFARQGIVIPTLEEAFAKHRSARWIVEIKPDTAAAGEALCRAIRSYGLEAQVLAASFHERPLAAFRGACPEVATSMSESETRTFVIAAYMGLSRFAPTPAVAMQVPERAAGIQLASRRVIDAAHGRGIRVQYWTINEPADMARLLALGADGLITDYVQVGQRAVGLAE